jgi:hypothetical protein
MLQNMESKIYSFDKDTKEEALFGVPIPPAGDKSEYIQYLATFLIKKYRTPIKGCCAGWRCSGKLFSSYFTCCAECVAREILNLNTSGAAHGPDIKIIFSGEKSITPKEYTIYMSQGQMCLGDIPVDGALDYENGIPVVKIRDYKHETIVGNIYGKYVCQSFWDGKKCRDCGLPHWVERNNKIFIEKYCQKCACATTNQGGGYLALLKHVQALEEENDKLKKYVALLENNNKTLNSALSTLTKTHTQ